MALFGKIARYPFTFEKPCPNPKCGTLISFTLSSREDLNDLVCHLCDRQFAFDPAEIERSFNIKLPAVGEL